MEKKIVDFLLSHSDLRLLAVYIFGSHASGDATDQSDIDIAILCEKPLEELELWDLTQSLAVQLNREVDLLDLRRVSTVICFQVLKTSKRIYCLKDEEVNWFEALAVSYYLKLNEERQGILDDVYKRGKVL